MLVRLLVTFGLLFVSVHSAVTSSPKSSPSNAAILPKQAVSFEHDEAVTVEGSGEGANLDEYADDDENEQLSKVTATTMRISSTSTTTTTTKKTTTTMRAAEKKPTNGSKSTDLDANEFDEDYKDDLEDNVDYNEVTSAASSPSTTSTRPSPVPPRHNTPVRLFFGFLTRPPIAAGILAGLAIGILTSVILLVCLVQRFNKRQRNHSSYTTGLLYPSHYGYSKSPQEFYA